MKILVTGGRDFTGRDLVKKTLLEFVTIFGRPELLIHGGARGADTICGEEATKLGIRTLVVLPDWERFKHTAAILRNQEMVDMKPDFLLPFPGGSGTRDCMKRAKKAGIPFYQYQEPLDDNFF
jgi:hypothetical protein